MMERADGAGLRPPRVTAERRLSTADVLAACRRAAMRLKVEDDEGQRVGSCRHPGGDGRLRPVDGPERCRSWLQGRHRRGRAVQLVRCRARCTDDAPSPSAIFLADAVFAVDLQRVEIGKQAAFGLGEVQAHRRRLLAVRKHLADVVHMRVRLVLRLKLLQRDQRRRESFGQNPVVVARDSLLRHRQTPHVAASPSLSRLPPDRH
ncbi:bll5255 [Bradyrhizobium diazoefficiens USDA 110]|uniref:Bll5255 protein n=1 Tax=Bradyrhizobium diazoefficiens (strain JCM 10833 / BCRC 13528 / IAM 13628 / NBRC 14792 / USDA 110) TaxID=224911 RepID=Q89JM8_BRADU|nr:bll5255 [Bradyrhizobium diazoefficiens USDA 110]